MRWRPGQGAVMRAGRRPASEELGATVEKLAVLVGVGISPAQAWRYLAEAGEEPAATEVVRMLDRGASVPEAVARMAGAGVAAGRPSRRGTSRTEHGAVASTRRAWAVLATAWAVAIEAGAPLARCLGDISDALRAAGRVERDITAALAGPTATTRLVVALPLVSLAAGALMGLDTLGALLGSAAGIICLLFGLALVVVGRLWSGWLLRRARTTEPVAGVALDLVAVALSGGGSLEAATALVHERCGAHGLAAENDIPAMRSVLVLAARAGAPPGELLRHEAARIRRDAVSAATERAAALGVWLMVPLGVCILPAFFLLAVAPVLLGVLASTAWG
ncbi:type II secretion system F family protein [Herbiconiux sp. 11R-BC]|uniref:type II secretion system F family protein n=1 Tax=Herbiconiux sp. 11R-BC TaxID=3111637 RepID=UPI003BFD1DAA